MRIPIKYDRDLDNFVHARKKNFYGVSLLIMCTSCMEGLFILPKNHSQLTLRIERKKFRQSYYVNIHAGVFNRATIETFKGTKAIYYDIVDLIRKAFGTTTGGFYIGVEYEA